MCQLLKKLAIIWQRVLVLKKNLKQKKKLRHGFVSRVCEMNIMNDGIGLGKVVDYEDAWGFGKGGTTPLAL